MTKESKQRDDVTNQQTPEPSYQNQDDDEPLIPPQAPPDVPVSQIDSVPRVEPVPQVLKVPNNNNDIIIFTFFPQILVFLHIDRFYQQLCE